MLVVEDVFEECSVVEDDVPISCSPPKDVLKYNFPRSYFPMKVVTVLRGTVVVCAYFEVLFVFCILILKIYLCARLGTDFHNSDTGAG